MKSKKERIEWVRSWCEDTICEDLPRVLLVGDSITDGYQALVREKLKGVCYVDYIATSYPVDRKIYRELIKSIVKDSSYEILHFNHGLHCENMSVNRYAGGIRKLLRGLNVRRTIVANSTIVYEPDSMKPQKHWEKKLPKLNAAMAEIASGEGYPLNDLYSVSTAIGWGGLTGDGFHYTKEGYEILAAVVAEKIKGVL